jgi:CelD/BcsL family acetyltransferase involved in cellulose biosynthesis
LSVYTLNPLNDSRWTDFVEGHPRASIFHTPGWLEALHRTYGYEPVVYTTSAPAVPITNGIVFCRVNSWLTGDRMVSLPFADHCEPLVESPGEYKEILSSLQCTLKREKFKYVELRPLSGNALEEAGLQKDKSFCFHTLALSPTLEELFRRFQKDSIQRKIRRAEREALAYQEGRSELVLKKFYHLFVLTRRRHRAPPQPIDWFRKLVTCLGDRLKIRVASKADRPIASIMTLRHGDAMVYKYGGSDASAHNLGAMPFLFWNAIQDAKDDGVQKFDFGRTDCDNKGLITFKDRLGSERAELTYWRLPRWGTPSRGQWERKLKFAGPIFACMPDRLLTASGRMLYRHIG